MQRKCNHLSRQGLTVPCLPCRRTSADTDATTAFATKSIMSEDVISEEEPEDVYADFIDEESQRVKEVDVHPSTLYCAILAAGESYAHAFRLYPWDIVTDPGTPPAAGQGPQA